MSRFFGEAMTGQKVFAEIERIKSQLGFYPVVELAHACLALGFQGAPRTSTTAEALERDIQHDLYEIIEKAKARQSRYLSPHWEGQSLPSQAVRLYVPFWAVAGAVALALFILFIVLRTLLGHTAEEAAQTMVSLNPPTPVTLARRSSVPPPAPAPQSATQISQLDHIRKVLQPNISSGHISLETTPNQIIIRLPVKDLFQPGKISLLEDGRALLMYVVSALDDEKGPGQGHRQFRQYAGLQRALRLEFRSLAGLCQRRRKRAEAIAVAAGPRRSGRQRQRRAGRLERHGAGAREESPHRYCCSPQRLS